MPEQTTTTIQTIIVPVPPSLRDFARQQALAGGYFTIGEYIRALIRAEQMRRLSQDEDRGRNAVLTCVRRAA